MFNFPSAPSEGQLFKPTDSITYVYRAPAWKILDTSGTATIWPAPPANPNPGDLWWENDTGDLFVWYADADSAQWVQINVNYKAANETAPGVWAARADLVGDISFMAVVDGAVYMAGGLAYIGSPGATAIPDLPGLVPGGDTADPRHFGVVGNGVADDTAKLQAQANYCKTAQKFWLPETLTCFCSGDLDLLDIRDIDLAGRINFTDGKCLTAGGFAVSGEPIVWRFGYVVTTLGVNTVPSAPVLRLSGIKAGTITLGTVVWLDLHADAAVATRASSGYFSMIGGNCRKVTITRVGSSWINEFSWDGSPRLWDLSTDNTAFPDTSGGRWRINEPAFEGATTRIALDKVRFCEILNARFELTTGSPGITLGVDTGYNTITQGWGNSAAPGVPFAVTIPVVNLGKGNIVLQQNIENFEQFTLLNLSPNDLVLTDGGTMMTSTVPGLMAAGTTLKQGPEAFETANQQFYLSDFIKVEQELILRYDHRANGNAFRPRLYVFDANHAPVTTEPIGYVEGSGGPTFNVAGFYQYGSGINENTNWAWRFMPGGPVAYIKAGLGTTSGGPWYIEYIRIDAFLPLGGRSKGLQSGLRPGYSPLVLSAVPVGVARQGTVVMKSDGTARYISTAYVEQRVAVAAAAAATTVTLDAATGIAASDQILIALDSGATHRTTVSGAPAGAVVTLAAPLSSAAAIGRLVRTGRWITV